MIFTLPSKSLKAFLAVFLGLTSNLPAQSPETSLCIRHIEPMKYPVIAKSACIQGRVDLVLRIDEWGHVTEVTNTSGSRFLAASVTDNAKKWVYCSGPAERKQSYEFISGTGNGTLPERMLLTPEGNVVLEAYPVRYKELSKPQVIDTTVCEILANPTKFDGEFVRFRARLQVGYEVGGLVDPNEGCGMVDISTSPGTIETKGCKCGVTVHRRQVTLRENREYSEWQRYAAADVTPRDKKVKCVVCPRYETTATFTGRIDICKNGFGHMNWSDVQFVVESVTNVKAVDLLGTRYSKKEYR